MKLLVHLCCANCAAAPLQQLLLDDFSLKGLWFNPNIHPAPEYEARRTSVEDLARLWSLDIEYEESLSQDSFLSCVAGKGAARCEVCYSVRLGKTAELARRIGMDGFTTTLLVSPYQNFDKIREIGMRAARMHNTSFLASDFRPYFRRSQATGRELGFYRQKHCGCLHSEKERSAGKKAR